MKGNPITIPLDLLEKYGQIIVLLASEILKSLEILGETLTQPLKFIRFISRATSSALNTLSLTYIFLILPTFLFSVLLGWGTQPMLSESVERFGLVHQDRWFQWVVSQLILVDILPLLVALMAVFRVGDDLVLEHRQATEANPSLDPFLGPWFGAAWGMALANLHLLLFGSYVVVLGCECANSENNSITNSRVWSQAFFRLWENPPWEGALQLLTMTWVAVGSLCLSARFLPKDGERAMRRVTDHVTFAMVLVFMVKIFFWGLCYQ